MKEIKIASGQEGMRLDKLLHKYLDKASTGFIYKMLRKKNITLNDARAKGDERLKTGDKVCLYLSDDTIESFREGGNDSGPVTDKYNLDIIYENDDIIIANKPAGMLSQKAKKDDVSINEYLKSYCRTEGDDLFTPSVCNRLDRNTSGLITFGKTLEGSRMLSKLFRERLIDKYYLAIVMGKIEEKSHIKGYLIKDEDTNTVKIVSREKEGADLIETEYLPLAVGEGYTLLSVKLITGKPHQIRAHLSSEGYPIIGDRKYGISRFSAKRQMLHAYRMVFPNDMDQRFADLAGQEFKARMPDDMKNIADKLFHDLTL